jgi:translation initiation factor IF-3
MQRVSRAKEFLAENNRVKFNLKLRGREFMNPRLAFEKVNRVLSELSEVGRPEEEPKIVNKSIIVVVLKK